MLQQINKKSQCLAASQSVPLETKRMCKEAQQTFLWTCRYDAYPLMLDGAENCRNIQTFLHISNISQCGCDWPAGCFDKVPLGPGRGNTLPQPAAPGRPGDLWVRWSCRRAGSTGCCQSVSHCGQSRSNLKGNSRPCWEYIHLSTIMWK